MNIFNERWRFWSVSDIHHFWNTNLDVVVHFAPKITAKISI